MKRLTLLCLAVLTVGSLTAQEAQVKPIYNQHPDFKVKVNTAQEPICEGAFEPTVESLSAYECPEWFRNAKFGIWAHWGPQCQPEDGDWYGRIMYQEGSSHYNYQIDTKGHPSEFGFKDWIPDWKADRWDPDSLIRLYKETGARFFMTLANHHDNLDLFDSRYQPWNSVNMGPHKDIVGGWAEACRKYDMPFGVSVHAAHAWCWYETSLGADTVGPLKGVPYDGHLTKEDGKGSWWEGYDIQDLYEQRHTPSPDNRAWDWEEGRVTTPDQAYCDRFYNRTMQLINDYHPQIVYFDDTYLPLWPVCDAGLHLTANLYNRSMAENQGKNQAVVTGKVLCDWQKQTIMWDVERGTPDQMQDLPWQTCTCLGQWHYDKHLYYKDRYKTAAKVVQMLVDVVSKNGCLLLNVPLRGNGTMDPTEYRIVKEIGHWMAINGESIYDTRPWVVFGEGPSAESAHAMRDQGFNEGKIQQTAADIRFNAKGKNLLYVTLLGVPTDEVKVKSLGSQTSVNRRRIKSVRLLGSDEKVAWTQSKEYLTLGAPANVPSPEALVYEVVLK